MITIDPNGQGDFTSIEAALASVEKDTSPIQLFIKAGIYKERIEITRPNIALIGENRENTIITNDYYAKMKMEDGSLRRTFRTYSVFLDGKNITAENLTFVNSSGLGKDVGQAIAVYAEGDFLTFKNCSFLGSQDTLFTGPLPPTVIEPGGFTGPKEFAPRINSLQLYENCYIQGDIDFIFGSATAYFDNCEIFSQNINQEVNGYVTAPSTPQEQEFGYVFNHCHLIGDCPKESVYLGRPWRNYAKAVFMNCEMGAHIKREGFHDWNKTDSHATTFFAEYNSYGPGANDKARAPWVKILNEEEAKIFSKDNVFK
ncbi:pectinesterase family protein [Lachnotalea glycerini]|uniref:Pectinesterase n=1 Tax=Lachnotalea glycerini TaxID=1763509 RepID=A0A371JEV3_9FIRM|nr:pectinesterase family protein [Lachnotalea glycerini]RDY31216.1 pectin methylesterase [Lachnotalea glycerini]